MVFSLLSPQKPVFTEYIDMIDRDAIAKLQAAMLATQSLGELYALMEDYSYLEVMTVYNQFPPALKLKFNHICLRDTQAQMAAIYTTSSGQELVKFITT
jgi:hypothetical protein